MPLVVPDAGELILLALVLKPVSTSRNWELRLFANNIVIDEDTVLGDLTECAFAGYAAVPLVSSTWLDPITDTGRALSKYDTAAQQWTNSDSSAAGVYGYYVVDTDSGTLLWAENFTSPISVAVGGTLEVWPVLTGKSEY